MQQIDYNALGAAVAWLARRVGTPFPPWRGRDVPVRNSP